MKMVENVMNNLKTTKKEKVRKTRDIKSNYEFTKKYLKNNLK